MIPDCLGRLRPIDPGVLAIYALRVGGERVVLRLRRRLFGQCAYEEAGPQGGEAWFEFEPGPVR